MNNTHVRLSLSLAALLALAGCGTADPPLEGTFAGHASTPLPSPPLPDGLILEIDATLRLDASDSTFALDMDLASSGLTDVMDVRGTYVDANGMLTLIPREYVIDAATMNTQRVVDGELRCITLMGFAGTEVCLPEQTNAYTETSSQLSITLEPIISDVPGSIPMTLTRVP